MLPRHQVRRNNDDDDNDDDGRRSPRTVAEAAGVVLPTFIRIGVRKQRGTIKCILQTMTMRLVRLDAGFAEGGARWARMAGGQTARGRKEVGRQEGGHAPAGIRMQGLPRGRCVQHHGVGGPLVAALETRQWRRPRRRAAGGEHEQGRRPATRTRIWWW
jgi:hypothetical protein